MLRMPKALTLFSPFPKTYSSCFTFCFSLQLFPSHFLPTAAAELGHAVVANSPMASGGQAHSLQSGLLHSPQLSVQPFPTAPRRPLGGDKQRAAHGVSWSRFARQQGGKVSDRLCIAQGELHSWPVEVAISK